MKTITQVVRMLFLLILINGGYIYGQATQTGKDAANIPIRVNQVGYKTSSVKIATFVDPEVGYNSSIAFTPSSTFTVKRKSDNTVVYTGTVSQKNSPLKAHSSGSDIDYFSGDRTWHGDFSSLTTPGEYYVECNGKQSYPFNIDDNIYYELLKHAMRWYFYQRQGIPITSQYGKNWTHSGAYKQDVTATDYFNPGSNPKNVTKGWYDAGDPTKYVHYTASTLAELAIAFETNNVLADNWDIPESGNGIPDMLDEMKWEVDWLLSMQNTNGGVHNRVTHRRAGCDNFTDPGTDNSQRLYTAITSYATAIAGCGFARMARLMKPYDLNYSNQCLQAAIKARQWLMNNPNLTPADGKDYGSIGNISCGYDGSMSGDVVHRIWLDAELYRTTGESLYKTAVESKWNLLQTGWESEGSNMSRYVRWAYCNTPGADATKIAQLKTDLANEADYLVSYTNTAPYGVMNKYIGYWWGYNGSLCARGFSGLIAKSFGAKPANDQLYLNAAEKQLHYMLGNNAANYCYIVNIGSKSQVANLGAENPVMYPFHTWYGAQNQTNPYGPVPGGMVGGPNSWDVVSSMPSPPRGQPDAKSYLDGAYDNYWVIQEFGIYYQSQFVTLLAGLAGSGAPCNATVPLVLNVNPSALNLLEGTQGQNLLVVVTPTEACANRKAVTFSSSDTTVATVDQTGKVTPRRAGSANITITLIENPTTKVIVPVSIEGAPSVSFGTANIDGTKDAIYLNSRNIGIQLSGTPTSTDLSASWNAAWDNNKLYVYVDVNDEAKINDSGTSWWEDDAVEIYIDGNNDKNASYDANDFQIAFRWNDLVAKSSASNITFVMNAKANGYVLEAAIPWSSLGVSPATNKNVGFDVQINDDDEGAGRDAKISWNATADEAWRNPTYFGTIKLNNGTAPQTYYLNVINGQTSNYYPAGENVSISANTAPTGQHFKEWTGATVACNTCPVTSLIMPATDTEVSANFENDDPQTPCGVSYATPAPADWILRNDFSNQTGSSFTIEDAALKLTYPQWAQNKFYLILKQKPTSIESGSSYTVSFDLKGNSVVNVTDVQVGFASGEIWSGPTEYTVPLVSAGGNISSSTFTTKTVTLNATASGTGYLTLLVNLNTAPNQIVNFYLKNVSICQDGGVTPPPTHTLNIISLNGTVVKNPDKLMYNDGENVILTATASSGYSFSGWSGDTTSSSNPITVKMNNDKNLTANYTANPVCYILNINGVNGVVNKNPDKTCYNEGEQVTLTAIPNSGYNFAGWNGDVTGTSNPLTILMNSNKNITANFVLQTGPNYAVIASSTAGSLQSGNLKEYAYDGNTVTRWANDGTVVNGWIEFNLDNIYDIQGVEVMFYNGTTRTYPISILVNGSSVWSGSTTTTANYWTKSFSATGNKVRINLTGLNSSGNGWFSINEIRVLGTIAQQTTYTLTVNATNGSVVKNPNKAAYNAGELVTLTATPNTGYNFTSWSGGASGSNNPVDIIMNSNISVTANFEVIQQPISRYEAENATLLGTVISTAGSGFSGTGFVTSLDNNNDKITFTVNVTNAGSYPLVIRYKNACGICEKKQDVSINGGTQVLTQFLSTSSAWNDKSFGNITLNAGNNTIAIHKNWGWTDFDYITIGSTNKITGSENETSTNDLVVSLKVYPNPAYEVVNITIPNHNGEAEVSIISTEGRVVKKLSTNEKDFSIDIIGILPGIYILNINSDSRIINQKLIIR